MSPDVARRILLILALATLNVRPAAAEAPAGPATDVFRPVPTCAAAPMDGSIRVDGRLDEPAWRTAVPVTQFTQRDPHEGEAVSESTEVRVLIGEDMLYVGARLYDREPKKIRARLVRRDEDLDSDFFVVFVDSNHDRVNSVLF